MALKRKRSTASFASCSPLATTPSSTTASPLSYFYAQSKPVESLYDKPTWSFPTYSSDPPTSPLYMGGRTMKRHRDNRPEESSVHASTISKLFSAQREHPHAEPVLSLQPQTHTATTTAPQRSTLHSFWNINSIPAAPVQDTAMQIDLNPDQSATPALRCEDCDSSIQREDAMDLDDGTMAQKIECQGCRRRVCDGCAVLRNERVCLGCARMR